MSNSASTTTASNTGYAAATLVAPGCAACGEVIFRLLEALTVPVDKGIAEALYLAIATDTGCFRYSNVTAETMRIAAQLMDCGAAAYPINKVMFETKRLPRLRLEAYLIEHVAFFSAGRIGISIIPAHLRQQLGLTSDDLDDISGFARDIEGVEIGAMLRQQPDGSTKLSVRSSPAFDACAICAKLGGGGHKAAAGASLPLPPDHAQAALLQAIYDVYPSLLPQ